MKNLLILSATFLAISNLQALESHPANSRTYSYQRNLGGDEKLAQGIRDKLTEGLFSKGYKQVTVDVSNGNVALGGTVQTQYDKDIVENKVRSMGGVRSVDSQIIVTDRPSKII